MSILNFLDLPDDFELIKEVEEDNNLYYYIKPKHKIEDCKHCGGKNLKSNGFRTGYRHIRDTNYKGKLVGLMVKIPRYTCNNCTKSFTHSFQSFPVRKGMTHRLIDFIGKEGLSRSYQDIADKYGLEKQSVKNITDIYVKSLEKENRYPIKTPNNLAVLIIPMKVGN